MEWYTTLSTLRMIYHERLSKNPEKVFLTMDDLGWEFFEPVRNLVLEKLRGMGIC